MTEPLEHDNAPKRRVKFGPKPTQTVPFEWAEDMLTWMFDHHNSILGEALRHAGGFEPGRKRRGSGPT